MVRPRQQKYRDIINEVKYKIKVTISIKTESINLEQKSRF